MTSNSTESQLEPDVIDVIRRDFPTDAVPGVLERLVSVTSSLRIQRCIAFASRGHPWYFDFLCKLTKIDSRDVICAAEYARLDIHLYDFTRPIPQARIEQPYGTSEPDATKYADSRNA